MPMAAATARPRFRTAAARIASPRRMVGTARRSRAQRAIMFVRVEAFGRSLVVPL
jgi:hypothetical protein